MMLLTADILYVIIVHKGWTPSGVGLLAFGVFLDLALLLIMFVLAPQPNELKVDNEGLRLSFAGGRSISYRWDDKAFQLRMRWTEGVPGASSPARTVYLIRGVRPVRVFIPSEAFHMIVEEARKRKLAVETCPSPVQGRTHVIISTKAGNNPR